MENNSAIEKNSQFMSQVILKTILYEKKTDLY
jgi:hypothetical protein